MAAAGGGGEEDDFANRNCLIYPAIIFEKVHAEDQLILQPIFMAMYAIDMTQQRILNQSPSSCVFQPIEYDQELEQYMIACDLPAPAKLSYAALKALWSLNPGRIRSMCFEPYQDLVNDQWFLRLIVRVRSTRNPTLTCHFEGFLRSDKTFIRPGLDMATAASLAQTATSRSALDQEQELIGRLRDKCYKMLNEKTVLDRAVPPVPIKSAYTFNDNFLTQRNGNNSVTLCWWLPYGGAVDVLASSELWAEFSLSIDDTIYGIDTHPVSGRVCLYLDLYLFSPTSETLHLIDSRTTACYMDEAQNTEPWRLEVSGPAVADAIDATPAATSAKKRTSSNRPRANAVNKKKGQPLKIGALKFALNQEKRKRRRSEQEVVAGENESSSEDDINDSHLETIPEENADATYHFGLDEKTKKKKQKIQIKRQTNDVSEERQPSSPTASASEVISADAIVVTPEQRYLSKINTVKIERPKKRQRTTQGPASALWSGIGAFLGITSSSKAPVHDGDDDEESSNMDESE